MIYDYAHVQEPLTLSADVCVIGSGAGGSPVAWAAARAGKRVIVIEAGQFLTTRDFNQLEHEMFPKLYQESGGRSTKDKAIHVHQGKGVGGSTLHNINLCARLPNELYEEWRERYGLSALPPERLADLYTRIEALITVTQVEKLQLNPNSRVLKRGCDVLGYRGGYLKHNRVGCTASGFCEIGCTFDAKQNGLKVFIASAVENDAIVLTDTWVDRLVFDGRRVTQAHAWTRQPSTGTPLQEVTINAEVFCLSASGTGSAAILKRSEVPDPGDLVGSRIHLHPGAAVAGIFDEYVGAWRGVPQGYECTEFLDFSPGSENRVWIIPAFAHPAGVSAILSGFGTEHQFYMSHYSRMAALSPMVHDLTSGRVGPRGDFGVEIDYWMNESDQAQMKLGLAACARLLFAAGASSVILPRARSVELRSPAEIDSVIGDMPIEKHDLDITSVHPMSSVWMGDDPANSCVDSYGRYHHLDNIFVADTSLYPSSIGVAPQVTTYAMGLHVGEAILEMLG